MDADFLGRQERGDDLHFPAPHFMYISFLQKYFTKGVMIGGVKA